MYVSNHQDTNYDDLPFDGDKRLITRQQIYHINYDSMEKLNNGLIFGVYMNQNKLGTQAVHIST